MAVMGNAVLHSIHVHPVKAFRSTSLQEAEVEPWGLAGDRRWVLIDDGGKVVTQREQPRLALAARHAVPTFYPLSDYVRAGGLISYGANLSESWRQAGIYVGKIVKGTKVTDLPIIQPTKFELVINMKAAKALDLDVPPSLQQLADEVIE